MAIVKLSTNGGSSHRLSALVCGHVKWLKRSLSTNVTQPTFVASYGEVASNERTGIRSQSTVLIFGWVGCVDKYLAKYASMLHEVGVGSALRTTASTGDLFLRPARLRKLAEEALDLIQSTSADKPLYLFYLSNGGAFIHEHILNVLREEREQGGNRWNKVRIAGTIFDSAPAELTTASCSRALTEDIKSPVLRSVAYVATYAVFGLLYPPKFGFKRNGPFHDSMRSDPLPCPSLYIFSDTDTVTNPVPLAALIEDRKLRHPLGTNGIHVLRLHAADGESPHVSHLRTHRLRYVSAVERFLQHAERVHLERARELR